MTDLEKAKAEAWDALYTIFRDFGDAAAQYEMDTVLERHMLPPKLEPVELCDEVRVAIKTYVDYCDEIYPSEARDTLANVCSHLAAQIERDILKKLGAK